MRNYLLSAFLLLESRLPGRNECEARTTALSSLNFRSKRRCGLAARGPTIGLSIIKQGSRLGWNIQSKMFVSKSCRHSSARCAVEEADLKKIRFDDLFDR